MAYIELAGSRVSGIVLRYLAGGRIYPATLDLPEAYTVLETRMTKDTVSVQFADNLRHDFTYEELKRNSNATDQTSAAYPFKKQVPRVRANCVAKVVDYADSDGIYDCLKTAGFCIATGAPGIFTAAKKISGAKLVPESDIPPSPRNRGLRSSEHVNQKYSPHLRIVQGPFSGSIVNGLRVYNAIRTLEQQVRAAESVVYSGSRIQNESSSILEYVPVQEVHSCKDPQYCSSGPRIKPVVDDNRIRVSRILPDPGIPNFHEYIGYYSNFIRSCYMQSVKIDLLPGQVLIYSDHECLTSYTGGNRVLEVKKTGMFHGPGVWFAMSAALAAIFI